MKLKLALSKINYKYEKILNTLGSVVKVAVAAAV